MTETIVVFLIAGVAFVLSARWLYRTLAGKAEGCGCGESGCRSVPSSSRGDDAYYCKEGTRNPEENALKSTLGCRFIQ